MNKFIIATLAATALVPVGAAAQTSHSTSHSSSHSASSSSARSHSGVSWQHRGRGPGMHHRGRGPIVRHHPGGGGHQRFVIHRRDGKMMRGGHHGINRHRNYKRIERGFAVPHFWWGPRFHVQNWGMYGFPQPMNGRRWVRYYDDALLIDHSGRVHDGRWGMNWDEYGDRWAYDDQDIPYYDGEGDYRGEEDYGDVEGEEGAYAEHHGPPPAPCAQACPPPMPGYGYAHPHGYGYGWMHGGMVTITETTVHAAAPQVVTETVYVEERTKTKPRRSYKRAKPRPRPQPGERG